MQEEGNQELKGEKVRLDIVYKAIIRDFRKFYIQEFNSQTEFISKKRYKTQKFYQNCVDQYVESNFSGVDNYLATCTPQKIGKYDMESLPCFFSCLLYPKDYEKEENGGNNNGDKSLLELHSYFTSFN